MLPTIDVPRNSIAAGQAAIPHARRISLLLFLTALAVGLALLPLPLATVGLLGTVVVVLILLHPVWGLIALIPLIPFSSLINLNIGGFSAGGMEALLSLILLAWLLRVAVHRQAFIPHPPLMLPWLVWVGVILISWLGALSLGAALTETVKWLEMLALYLFIAANVERRHLPWLVFAILLAGMAQAALGLYQFLFRVGPEGFLLFGGRFLRAYGTFRQPNPYAGYLGLILPLAYSLILWGLLDRCQPSAPSAQSPANQRQGTALTTRYRLPITLYSMVAFGLMLAALYASQSRGAWIGFVAGVIAVSLVRGGRAAALFALAVAVLAILGALGAFQLLPQSILQRFGNTLSALSIPDIASAEVTDANFAAIERLAHWQAALHMWRDSPWTGVGVGNYAATYPAYAIGRWLDPLGHAHNLLLNVGAETGLVGLLAYGIFWLSAFGLGWRAVRRSTGFELAVAAGALGVLVHLSVHNMVDNLFVQGMYLHVTIMLGLLCVIYQTKIDNSSRWD